MFKFLLEIIIVCGFGVVLYLFARALPRIEEGTGESREKRSKSDALSVYLEKIDEWIGAVMEKFLRRAKIWVLKLDNFVSVRLNRFKNEPLKEKGFEDPADDKENEAEEKEGD